MAGDTLGHVAMYAYQKRVSDEVPAWQAVADAVVSEYEARRWKPIDSAPKDETPILALAKDWTFPDIVWRDGAGWCHQSKPTHWTPIPAPPKEVE